MDLPQAGGQSVVFGLLLYAIRWIDRRSIAPKINREDTDARFGETDAKIKWLGRNKCENTRVDLLEEQYEERLARIEYKLGIKRGI